MIKTAPPRLRELYPYYTVMSSQSDPPPPIREQNVLISSDIHPTLTFLFIIGMYTAIYPASTYIYRESYLIVKSICITQSQYSKISAQSSNCSIQ